MRQTPRQYKDNILVCIGQLTNLEKIEVSEIAIAIRQADHVLKYFQLQKKRKKKKNVLITKLLLSHIFPKFWRKFYWLSERSEFYYTDRYDG